MINLSNKRLRHGASALATVLVLSAGALSAAAAERTYTFEIPAENTARALNDFSHQAGVEILFPYDLAAAHAAPAISGDFTRSDVLARLLAGSGLEVAAQSETSITLRAVSSAAKTPAAADPLATQVIVTGTNIRNANPTSPVHVITKTDIERSGFAQIGDLMRSLPENFGGGQNPGEVAASAGNIANQNLTNASTVNLRGLGTDATLVLVNGHRLNADSFYQGVDISAIPLGAVQRIEVVPDGASALYGSDAVAGVVNILLRKDLNGGEWKAHVGTATQGGGLEQGLSVMDGVSGNRGHILADLEYFRQEPVTAGERGFTAGMDPTYTLLRFQERRSLYIDAGYNLSDNLALDLDGLTDDRRAVMRYTTAGQAYANPVYTPAYNWAATLDATLPDDWNLKASGVISGSRNSYWSENLTAGTATHTQYKNWAQSVEVIANGPLFTLPGGTVKGAFGSGYRTEGFQQAHLGSSAYLNATRNVAYLYGEVLAPLVASSPDRTGLHELELSLSGRTETYNDLGTSATPKLGLRYVPLTGLTLHSTWGKSFKAPSLTQMYSASTVYIFNATALGGTGTGTAFLTYGGNTKLKPERSTSWTFGADYKLPWSTTGVLSINYFHIDYVDRVVLPISNSTQSLSSAVYAPFVETAPPAADQAAAIAAATQVINVSSGAYNPATVQAIVRDQYLNATSQTAHGIDLSYRDTYDLSQGTLSTFANATWIRLNQQTLITLPQTRLSGTLFNVPTVKGRAGATWLTGPLAFTAAVNYLSGQLDGGVTPNVVLAPSTTVDTTLTYTAGRSTTWAKGLKISLAVTNLFDKEPPRTLSPLTYTVPHFDSTNGSIMGRFVSLTLTKDW